jgi:subtilisin-like proprotein convertase family protein
LSWSLLFSILLLAAAPAFAQSKEAMHQRMIDLARQMDALKPTLAANPANAYAWSQLMDEYRQMSQAMGGDDPGKAIPDPFAPAGTPSAPQGTVADPQGCGPITQNFTNGTDVAIPAGPAVVSSTILVANAGPYLWDLDLTTFITHTFAADLDITLMSPSGTIVTLTTDNGAGNDNVFNGTVWRDQANPAGQVPYVTNNGVATDHAYVNATLASPLVPEEAMAAFRGQNPNGTWTLTISDDLAGDSGVLDSWTLSMDVMPSDPIANTLVTIPGAAVAIPTGPAVVTAVANNTIAATVCGIEVAMNLTHTFAADLDITLMSPAGTISTLTTDNGAGNDNVFAGTSWRDLGDPDGQVPYVTNNGLVTDHAYVNLTVATPLVPEEGMGAFQGEEALGAWTITISDDLAGDGGNLVSWSVGIFPCACASTGTPRRADAHPSGGASNVNGVIEPAERFLLEGRMRNTGPAFSQNFEGIFPPVLPRQWTANLVTGLAGDQAWRTSNVSSHSAPTAVFAGDPSHISDNFLETPTWTVDGSNQVLDFWHRFNMEDTFDGGVLEVSIGGGAFQDAVAAGGGFFIGGYTDTIDNCCGNPIATRQAWSGDSAGFIRSFYILPAAAIGQTVKFRFRAATDHSISDEGWYVDSVALGGIADATLTAQTFGFGGPGGAIYTAHDTSADYGTMNPGVSNNCFDATGNCYDLEIGDPGPRPVLHWDAVHAELTSTGSYFQYPLHVGNSFTDVATGSGFYRFIETLLHHGITGGCGPTTYCPSSDVLREQMAVFLLVAKFGSGYAPPPCGAQVFGDVPCSSGFAPWINELFAQGITGGCGGGNFCPASPVLREQMAVFLLVAYEGTGYTPPACTTPMFGDVPCSSGFAPWINEVFRRGITSGCGGGNYCPAVAVTREQMAVFLTQTWALSLY